jgi:hypothetical protein
VKVNQKEVEAQKLVKQFEVGGAAMNQRSAAKDYDFESVMHYPGDGLLEAKVEPVDVNTQRMGWYFAHGEEMSPKDKKKLEALYSGLSSGKHTAMKLNLGNGSVPNQKNDLKIEN